MSVKKHLKHFENQIRLRTARTWALGLALCMGLTALMSLGFGMSHSSYPAAWSSTFSILAYGGFLRQVVPLFGVTIIILLIIAVILHLFIDKN